MIGLKPKKGKLLIAEPSLTGDVSFNRSVVLLAEHNQEGSVGFILNKPLNYSIDELVEEIQAPFPVYNGGPVEQDNLYFIHTVPDLIPHSVLINSGKLSEDEIRFFLGYSGWASFQLDQELNSKSWIVVSNKYESDIIQKPTQTFWREKMMELGGQYLLWSNAPENPSLN